MNYVELTKIKPGDYRISERKTYWKFFTKFVQLGWLSVTHEVSPITNQMRVGIMWTTDRYTHDPLTEMGPAKCIYLSRGTGELECYMESAIFMWIKWGYGRGGDEDLQRAIKFADWCKKYLVKEETNEPN